MSDYSNFSLRSLIITILIYGAFPMLFSYFRKTPITKKRVFVYSFSVNFVIMVILIAIAVSLELDQKAIPSGFPYVLWTTIFSNTGIGVLTKHNLIIYPAAKYPVQNVTEYRTPNSNPSPNDQDTAKIPVYWVGQGTGSNFSNSASSMRQRKKQFCENCGTKLPEGEIKFCPNCGAELLITGKAP